MRKSAYKPLVRNVGSERSALLRLCFLGAVALVSGRASGASPPAPAELPSPADFVASLNDLFQPSADRVIELKSDSEGQWVNSRPEEHYDAIAENDPVKFGCAVLEAYRARCTEVWNSGSAYSKDALRKELRRSKAVRRLLKAGRKYLGRHVFVSDGRGFSVTYGKGVFTANICDVDGDDRSTESKLQQCSLYGPATSGVSVGLWKKLRWRRVSWGMNRAGTVRLAGVPESLKPRLESELGNTITTRWRWRGIGKVRTVKSESMGYVLTYRWIIPSKLRLEFLDGGELVWSVK